jgi:hypothetical protein
VFGVRLRPIQGNEEGGEYSPGMRQHNPFMPKQLGGSLPIDHQEWRNERIVCRLTAYFERLKSPSRLARAIGFVSSLGQDCRLPHRFSYLNDGQYNRVASARPNDSSMG